jgi:hypothetical protein
MNDSKDIPKSNLNDNERWEESWMYVKMDVMAMADMLAKQALEMENRFKERTGKLEFRINELEKKLKK